MPTAAWIAWAARKNTQKVIAALLSPMRVADSTVVPLYTANTGGAWDGVHSWKPNVQSVSEFNQTADAIVYGRTILAEGSLELKVQGPRFVDQGNSITWDQLLTPGAYAWFGQAAQLWVGGPDLAWADWAQLPVAYMGQPSFDRTQIVVPIFSGAEKVLEKQIADKLYGTASYYFPSWAAGVTVAVGYLCLPKTTPADWTLFYEATSITTGTTGGSEPTWPTSIGSTVVDGGVTWTCRQIPSGTKGVAKPLTYGNPKNIQPVLIDEASYLYQFHDDQYGAVQAVDTQYVNGAVVVTGTANLTYGTIRFSSKPNNTPTLDVRGKKISGTYSDLPGDVAKDILTVFGGVSAGSIYSTGFSQFNTDVPYGIGLYITDKTDIASALDAILTGLLSFWGNRRDGAWTVKRFQAASGSPVFSLTDVSILDASFAPYDGVYYACTVRGDRNWTTSGSPDASITQDRKTWLADEYREQFSSTPAIQTAYPLAGAAGPHDSLLSSLTNCGYVAGWWVSLFGTQRLIATVKCKMQPLQAELGDVVSIATERYGMSAGVLGRIVSIQEVYGTEFYVVLGVVI